ncbi:MAG: RecQ family ATP-dependent DNA helicase [Clostridium sp.]|nr:RecQ family ATP-dependent DNA helicase [Clostridium sp.]
MKDRYHSILKQYWGYDDFRGIQRDIIESIGSGKDTLGLMPTGGGKSITFQVPALAQEGICIVVTPLIALMKDQVANLRRRGIKAAAVYSGLSREEIIVTLENCIFGGYKFLYLSPERLSSDIFLAKLRHMNVSFITVDEAHCISQWGYDFRPSYTRIAEIRREVPHAPVLALTATATPEVMADIQHQLEFREENAFRMSFERTNLTYVVRTTEDKKQELIHILTHINGSAIVYTRNRRGTRETAQMLVEEGITATYYHAGLNNADKDERQRQWQSGETRVMVATNAFGMGIDKPDVRLVTHLDLPDSPEAYFQEAGRAGRDGLQAYAVLLYHPGDRAKLARRIPDTYPDPDFIRTVYEHICYYYQMAMGDGLNVTKEFNLDDFCRKFKHFPVPTDSALKILTRAGYIEYTEEQENASRLMFTVRRDDLYRLYEQNETEEKILQWVLRCYGGVFSDYVYIDEGTLAHHTGLTAQQVYDGLVNLNRRYILHYIPRKKTPYITFTCKRVETERIVLKPAVYSDRKESYRQRIATMSAYASGQEECRSRTLLRYFGEDTDHDCERCDVCRSRHESGLCRSDYEKIRRHVLQWLVEQGPARMTDIPVEHEQREIVGHVVHCMLQEEELTLENGILRPGGNSSQPYTDVSRTSD